jgi:hypothetical protein
MTLWKTASFASVLLCAALSTTCASERASLVQTRPEFKVGAHRIGIVGLFRHGRLDDMTWNYVARELVRSLGTAHCSSAYARSLREAEPDTYAALDRRIKEEGLSNEALALLIPYTDADLLLILDARDPRTRAARERKDPTDLPGRPVRSGHARNATHTSEPTNNPLAPGRGYSMTASLFSVSLQKLVARADTHETRTLEGAAAELSQRLRSLLPGSTCAEWKWLASPPPAAPEVPAAAPDASTSAPAAAPDTSAAGAPAE